MPQSGLTVHRVALLGFMSSGKSAVGQALARRLEWGFIDFDVEIETREGHPVAAIIAERGEEYFRRLERALTEELSGTSHVVLAPGGGWILQPDLLQLLNGGSLSVWLSCSPVEIVRRLRDSDPPKPLADRSDALEAVAALLAEREHLYSQADLMLPTDTMSVETVAYELEKIVRGR